MAIFMFLLFYLTAAISRLGLPSGINLKELYLQITLTESD